MTKHKHEPDAPAFTLADAAIAAETAKAKRLSATAAVEAACRAFPGMSDRRLLLDLQRLSGYERERLASPGLLKGQREALEHRLAFHDAIAVETKAIAAHETAERLHDDMQKAADLIALGDGRAALDEAIREYVDAERAHQLNAAAIGRADDAVMASYGAEGDAERDLATARAEVPARLAAEFRGEIVEPGQTVEQAEAALQSVLNARQAAKAAKAALETEGGSLGWALRNRRDRVSEAAVHVVKTSPATRALFEACAAAEQRFTALRLAVDRVGREGATPEGFGSRSTVEPDRSLEHAWTAALDALRTDPAAPLPEMP